MAAKVNLPQQPQPRLQPSCPAGQVVLAYLRQQVDLLKSLDPLVRADEPDSVHQMRVAGRRLRSTLRTFRDIGRLRLALWFARRATLGEPAGSGAGPLFS